MQTAKLDPMKMLEKRAKTLYARCEAGDTGACLELRGSTEEQFLSQGVVMPFQAETAAMKRLAEGGDVGFMSDDAEMYGYGEGELEDLVEGEEAQPEGNTESPEGMALEPLLEVLGEEAFAEIAALAEAHPAVAQLAVMAIKTSDGKVDGIGGPKDDKVPALLSPDEFVFSAEAVEAIGLDKLEAMHEAAKREAMSA